MLLVLGIIGVLCGGAGLFVTAWANGMSDAPMDEGIGYGPSWVAVGLGVALIAAWFVWGGRPLTL